MRRTNRSFAAALVLVAILPACALLPGPDPRCVDHAPDVEDPAGPRTAPEGWPAPPPGDAICGVTFQGDEISSSEVVIVVTDRPFTEVLDHFEREMPPSLPVERHGSGDDERLWGYVPGLLYAIESAGDHRYAFVFQVLADARDLDDRRLVSLESGTPGTGTSSRSTRHEHTRKAHP